MSFNGIPNLRDAYEKIKVTSWQLDELKKCARDPIYFIRNYVYINTANGMDLFKMYPYQEEFIRAIHENRYILTKYPRQSGKSATTRGYLLWHALFHRDNNIMIMANKLELAQEQLQQLRDSYIQLPYWMQPGVKSWNKRTVELSNGSRIKISATTKDGARGFSIDVLYLDEFAFIEEHIALEFIQSVFPVVASKTKSKVIITSTPNGTNHFHKMWVDALDGKSDFKTMEIAWNEVPGRTDEWAEKEIRRIGEVAFGQEFKCDFIGSTYTLVDSTILKAMKGVVPFPLQTNDPEMKKIVNIWEWPISLRELKAKNWEYVACLDTGYGMKEDSTVLQIFLVINNLECRQVARISANYMDAPLFCRKTRLILKAYHDPALIIEQPGPGESAVQYYQNDANYDNMIHFDPTQRKLGLWANENIKDNAARLFKMYVQNGYMKIKDEKTIEELLNFGRVNRKKWGALSGKHDDHVMACIWVPFYLMSPYFYGTIKELSLADLNTSAWTLTGYEDKKAEYIAFTQMQNRENISNMLKDAAEFSNGSNNAVTQEKGLLSDYIQNGFANTLKQRAEDQLSGKSQDNYEAPAMGFRGCEQ
jgi:hypothetical protein